MHPVGWCHVTGHELGATEGKTNEFSNENENIIRFLFSEYKTDAAELVRTKSYPSNIASPDLFRQVKEDVDDDEESFKEGMKLEAVDPLEMSRICPATVVKVKEKQILIEGKKSNSRS